MYIMWFAENAQSSESKLGLGTRRSVSNIQYFNDESWCTIGYHCMSELLEEVHIDCTGREQKHQSGYELSS